MKQSKSLSFNLGVILLLIGFQLGLFSCPAFPVAKGWSVVQNLTSLENVQNRDARDPAIYVGEAGVIHVVYREREIYYLRSEDKGRSWKEAKIVSGDRLVNGAPTVIADQDGIHVVWPSLQISPNYTYYQLFYARSEDQGQTWTLPAQLTNLESHSQKPALLKRRSGIALLWYELDERELPRKNRLEPRMLLDALENPIPGLVPREYHKVLRNTILVSISTSGGRSWGKPILVREVLRPLDLFIPYQMEENSFGVYWGENRQIVNRISKDGGMTWDSSWDMDQYLDPFFFNQLVYSPEGIQLLGIPREPYKSHRIRQYDVNTRQEVEITQPTFFRSTPKATYGGGETHLVWSISDKANTWIAYQRSDRVPPYSRIISPEDPNITTHSFKIAWEGEDDISMPDSLKFSRLKVYGGKQWTLFEPGQFVVVGTPPDGKYVFKVRSMDEAGNMEPEPSTIEFNTYGVPPETFFDPVPPAKVEARSLQVTWSGKDNTLTNPSDLEYSYQFDDGAWSPWRKILGQTFRGLKEGPHRILVRSRDNHLENIDLTPSEAKFDVVLNITVAFRAKPNRAQNRPEIQFSWVGSDETDENEALFFSHRLDGGTWSEWSISDTVAFNEIEEGNHTFEVQARDEIGNQSKIPLVHEFFVDLTPPETSAELDMVIQENDYTPIIALGGTDNLTPQDQLSFEYRIGNEDWQRVGENRMINLPSGLNPWSPGYTLEVRAKDAVQNKDLTPSVIDLTFPGRYFRYSLGTLGVPILYPILGGLILLVLLAVFILIIILVYRKIRAPKKPPVSEEEEEEDILGGTPKTTSPFDDDDDLFGSSSTSDDTGSADSIFDDEDDLFS